MRMKQGDLFPFLYNLQYDDGTAIDLTTADSVKLYMTLDECDVPTIDGAACEIEVATDGSIEYYWVSGDTDEPGMYKIEFVITFNNGSILTVPSNDILWMLILPSQQR